MNGNNYYYVVFIILYYLNKCYFKEEHLAKQSNWSTHKVKN